MNQEQNGWQPSAVEEEKSEEESERTDTEEVKPLGTQQMALLWEAGEAKGTGRAERPPGENRSRKDDDQYVC